jgi:hypothetical protein
MDGMAMFLVRRLVAVLVVSVTVVHLGRPERGARERRPGDQPRHEDRVEPLDQVLARAHVLVPRGCIPPA